MFLDRLKSDIRYRAFRIEFLEMAADAIIKLVEVFVTPISGCPINLCERRVAIIFCMKLINSLVQLDYLGLSSLIVVVGIRACNICLGHPFRTAVRRHLLQLFWIFTTKFLDYRPECLANVHTYVTAKIYTVYSCTGLFQQVGDSIADDTRIKVAGMKDFKRIWVGVFRYDCFSLHTFL